ncbi:MAG TPA: nicotinamidase [Candidatus Hydrogenedentes bacterium]|nr:nicotinamidase [Candidatus Hydrogenedentota bacterium]HOL76963.1 nicotinamidase [Candidatus Hydrogenedentota bacterium]HPO86648.1 nicotinamidase [Candidatus Hydrogenedentota bacterium]
MRIDPARDALIVVDVQRDFCPGGALAVREGDEIVPLINQVIPRFEHLFFTRDWHPADHCSFSPKPQFVDKSWPAHCVQGTTGAEFHPLLLLPENAVIISKGVTSDKEAYSGFDNTPLAELLKKRHIQRLFICGLATDYCVKATALDGLKNGFTVVLFADACRGVDIPPGTVEETWRELRDAGALSCSTGDLA